MGFSTRDSGRKGQASSGAAAHPGWRVRAQPCHPGQDSRERPARIRTRKAGLGLPTHHAPGPTPAVTSQAGPVPPLPSENPMHPGLRRALVTPPVCPPAIQPHHGVPLPPHLSSHMAQRRAHGPSLANLSAISVVRVWACGSSLASESPPPPQPRTCVMEILGKILFLVGLLS